MKQEFIFFFNALLYYSRIPVPYPVECTEQTLSHAFRYLPLVGILIGLIGGITFLLAHIILPHSLAVALSMVATLLLTGCFHEDGFADFCDGFGGGHNQEHILAIMKDSHIGVYGVIGLIMLLGIKFIALCAIPASALPFVLVASHAISRIYPLLMVRSSTYARQGASKAQHTRQGISATTCFIGCCFGLLPLVFMPIQVILCFLPLSFGLYLFFKRYLHTKIQGFTGDTLGALQQLTEGIFYLTFTALAVS